MPILQRVTLDPTVMGGKPCIQGTRVTVGTIVGLVAAGHTEESILQTYPYLKPQDVHAALTFAAWRVEEMDARVAHP
jgi:uncharacterized protein (DUF433 family)